MQTRSFPSTPDARSPAGAEIRYLMEGETGGMIHSTVPPGQVNRATVHATVRRPPFWKRAFPSTSPSGRHSSIAAPVPTRSSSSA